LVDVVDEVGLVDAHLLVSWLSYDVSKQWQPPSLPPSYSLAFLDKTC